MWRLKTALLLQDLHDFMTIIDRTMNSALSENNRRMFGHKLTSCGTMFQGTPTTHERLKLKMKNERFLNDLL